MSRSLVPLSFAALAMAAATGIAIAGHPLWGAVAAMVALVLALISGILGQRGVEDPGRRRLLTALGLGGVALATGGLALGDVIRRSTRPDPTVVVDEMASGLGTKYMEFMRRGYYPGRSGELQLVLSPGGTSNYDFESTTLGVRDPRSAHASVWNYLQRVPIVVYAPGAITQPQDITDEVTLADITPTIARLMGFGFVSPDGVPLPGIDAPKKAPKVVVTFVIDGGGWNVLKQWPNAWPNLAGLMRDGVTYRNAFMGSFPAVTACAHATIGTGAFPRHHGISGHNIRTLPSKLPPGQPLKNGGVYQAYGSPGKADTSTILVPTLAEAWSAEADERAWIGEIGYQNWHLGMIGRGGDKPLGRLPVAVYFDDSQPGSWTWAPQNPESYRMPEKWPDMQTLYRSLSDYQFPPSQYNPTPGMAAYPCCSPPVIEHQGMLIRDTFDSEPVGQSPATSLFYINFKQPDYTGHVYNMIDDEEAVVLQAVDAELGKVRALLESRFKPGEYALIVCADHGQCPLPETVGGVRLDPIQLASHIDSLFPVPAGRSLVQYVRPSEIYLDRGLLWALEISEAEVAAALHDYTYQENFHIYRGTLKFEGDKLTGRTSPRAYDAGDANHREFAAVLPGDFVASLGIGPIARFGPGDYPHADIGMQPMPE